MNKSVSSLFETTSPMRFLLLFVPFVLTFILGAFTMGAGDASCCLWWAVVLLLFGLLTLPLAVRLWENFSSGGFFLSQPMGLIFTCLVLWTLGHLKIFKINLICIVLSAVIVGVCCYVPKTFRKTLIKKLETKGFVEAIVAEEFLFLIIFFLMCYFKGFLPNINGQEKYMDYGFMMSMLRNGELPAKDPWLSGYSINYYYFGQYIWSVMVKLTGIKSGIGYNLAMCSATAIPFAMSFSIGKFLVEAAVEKGFNDNKLIKYVAGIASGLAVSIWGNSHSFFYDQESVGNSLLSTFRKWGIDVGRTDNYFYPDSTRYIGWNPELTTNGGDYTIEEFPFYSYLVGDLHAHVISMMIVLLIAAIILSLVSRVKLPSQEEIAVRHSIDNLGTGEGKSRLLPELKSSVTLELALCAILLGCAQMTNYWDFLIYFIFFSMGSFLLNTIRSPKFTTFIGALVFIANVGGILLIYLSQGENPVGLFALEALLMIASFMFCVVSPSALPRTSFQMSFVFTFASFTALTFNTNFDMISNSLGAVKNRSPLYQLFILWGTHVIISVFFMLVVFSRKNFRYISSVKAKKKAVAKNYSPEVIGRENEYTNPVQQFFAERNVIDIFVCGMTIVGIMLLAAPEIFYVRDIYTGGYLRSNTMFKFTFAAFIILSLTMIYAIIRLYWFVNKKGKYSTALFAVALLFTLMLFVPAHYTMASLKQRCGDDFSPKKYKTLDGTAYIEDYTSFRMSDNYAGNLSPYLACAEWFNSCVEGSPVICESYGDSYTDSCIVSAYTGLPTVFGWQTHEWLWRYHGIVDKDSDILVADPERDVWKLYITPRHRDIDIIYQSQNTAEVQTVINRYNIEYIVIGDMERFNYAYDNSYTISQLGQVVFQNEDLTVYKVRPADINTASAGN
ncbi:MAG: hypothetical protein IKF31_08985 [Clostridiales bacterium]|nr:hypothetical protein [Clostridiales bacterium]